MSGGSTRFTNLPTPAKLLVLMLLALFPLGLAISMTSYVGLQNAHRAIEELSASQADSAVRAIDALIARNSLALRVAANAALRSAEADHCAAAKATLAIAPAVERDFSLADAEGQPICNLGPSPRFDALRADRGEAAVDRPLAPGDIRMWISPDTRALAVAVGVAGGSAIEEIDHEELRAVALRAAPDLTLLSLGSLRRQINFSTLDRRSTDDVRTFDRRLGDGTLRVRLEGDVPRIMWSQRLLIMMPLIMLLAAAMLAWAQTNRLLVRPLRLLEARIGTYQPGTEGGMVLPDALGPAREIRELGASFVRAVARIEETERAMGEALDGQRRLVREVHHRVKNNLQVIASLLSIHGRAATDEPARDAYAAIARRVEALSVVHRNHYAEMEENRGIALRPLLTELGAGLRASAPDTARAMTILLDVANLSTTQDAAVAAAFFITEIAEYAMFHCPDQPVDIVLRRSGELEGQLAIASAVLVPLAPDERHAAPLAQVQFERILEALARQLRSPLERKLGNYSVTMPIFPDA